jgi:hypothetical protein
VGVRKWALTVPKLKYQANEDSYQRSRKGVYALSDGASVSFDSASWSRILVRRFAQNPKLSKDWVHSAIRDFKPCGSSRRERPPATKAVATDSRFGKLASCLIDCRVELRVRKQVFGAK